MLKGHVSQDLPPTLLDAIRMQNLVIVCGAGISMLPPSNLPNWWGFNESLLEAIKCHALYGFPQPDETLVKTIQDISLTRLNIVGFSQEIANIFGQTQYLPLLETLDSKSTNANHHALVHLMRAGTVRAIVSTNFDTLIERAFREEGVPLTVLASDNEFRRVISPGEILYKVHGSVTNTTTLVDTAKQKLMGLPKSLRMILDKLFSNYHILVVGLSGADLVFDEDYFSFLSVTSKSPGITWLMRGGESVRPEVAKLLEMVGKRGSVVVDSLPQFFGKLGLDMREVAASVDNPKQETSSEDSILKFVQAFLDQRDNSSIECACFCANILEQSGKKAASQKVYDILAPYADNSSLIRLKLAEIAGQDGDYETAMAWGKRESEQAYQFDDIEKTGNSTAFIRLIDDHYRAANAWLSMFQPFFLAKEFDKANAALTQATRHAESISSQYHFADIYYYKALLGNVTGEQIDIILSLIEQSRTFARDTGNITTLYHSSMFAASLLNRLVEYDAAEEVLQDAEKYSQMVGGYQDRFEEIQIYTEFMVSRGNIEQAAQMIKEFKTTAIATGADAVLGLVCDWLFCRLCGTHEAFHDEVVRIFDALIAYVETHGLVGNIPDLTKLQTYKNAVIEGNMANPAVNAISSIPAQVAGDERAIRTHLAKLEFSQQLAEIPKFLKYLCDMKYKQNQPYRLLQLGRALLKSYERIRSNEGQSQAWNQIGIAHEILGNLSDSVDAYESAMSLIDPNDLASKVAYMTNYARSLVYAGQFQRAEDILNQVLPLSVEVDDKATYTRAQLNLADSHAKQGHLYQATEILSDLLDDSMIDPDSIPTVKQKIKKWQVLLASEGSESQEANYKRWLQSGLVPNERPVLESEDIENFRELAESANEYGNLTNVIIEAGYYEEAIEFAEKTIEIYKAEDNELGVSISWNNIAQIAAERKKWDDAIHFSEKALSIRRQIGDISGQILTLSNLAQFYWQVGLEEPEKRTYRIVIKYANSSLQLAKTSPPSVPQLYALHALMLAYSILSMRAEAYLAKKQFDEMATRLIGGELTKSTIENLESIQNQALQLNIDVTLQEKDAKSSFFEMLDEVERLKRIQHFDDALQLIEPCFTPELEPEQLARLYGTKANVLQRMQDHESAIVAYERSAELFRSVDNLTMSIYAAQQSANSMRHLRQFKRAEDVLRNLLKYQNMPDSTKSDVLLSLAMILMYMVTETEQTEEQRSAILAEFDRLFSEAISIQNRDENYGIIYLNWANIALQKDDFEKALNRLKKARQYFITSNSEHLELCEQTITKVQNHAKDQQADD